MVVVPGSWFIVWKLALTEVTVSSSSVKNMTNYSLTSFFRSSAFSTTHSAELIIVVVTVIGVQSGWCCSLTGRRLFRRAIVHSGSATASWAVAKDHRTYTAALADRLNCTPTDAVSSTAESRLIVHCLRQIPAAELVQAAAAVAFPPVKYLSAYGPTMDVDNEVLPASSVEELMDNACRLDDEYVHVQFSVVVTTYTDLTLRAQLFLCHV